MEIIVTCLIQRSNSCLFNPRLRNAATFWCVNIEKQLLSKRKIRYRLARDCTCELVPHAHPSRTYSQNTSTSNAHWTSSQSVDVVETGFLVAKLEQLGGVLALFLQAENRRHRVFLFPLHRRDLPTMIPSLEWHAFCGSGHFTTNPSNNLPIFLTLDGCVLRKVLCKLLSCFR